MVPITRPPEYRLAFSRYRHTQGIRQTKVAQAFDEGPGITLECFIDPLADRQMMTVILSMGDALVASAYQEWGGLEQTKPSKLGFDPGERNLERA